MHCVNLDLRILTVKYVEENLALNMSFLKHILYRRLARQGMMHLMLMTKEGISVTYVGLGDVSWKRYRKVYYPEFRT